MKSLAFIILILSSVLLFGEATHSLVFTKIQTFVPGQTTKLQITTAIGKPSEVTPLKDIASSKITGEQWEYLEKDIPRTSLSFEDKSDILQGWSWSVLEGDAEQNLKVVMSKFPEASWKVETVKWVNPHHLPNECYFKDRKQGLSIEFNRTRKEVTSISRWNPTREPSTSENNKPPKYCIDGHCADGISGSEYLKKWPLCDVPK